jgi:hypothetical protein
MSTSCGNRKSQPAKTVSRRRSIRHTTVPVGFPVRSCDLYWPGHCRNREVPQVRSQCTTRSWHPRPFRSPVVSAIELCDFICPGIPRRARREAFVEDLLAAGWLARECGAASYSALNTTTRSTESARRSGTQIATHATPNIMAAAPVNVVTSSGGHRRSIPPSSATRVAVTQPRAMPPPTSITPWPTTRRVTANRDAPCRGSRCIRLVGGDHDPCWRAPGAGRRHLDGASPSVRFSLSQCCTPRARRITPAA